MTFLMILASVMVAVTPGEPFCERSRVSVTGTLLPSASWNPSGDLLLAADAAGGRLLRFSADGQRRPDIYQPGLGPKNLNKPMGLVLSDQGLMLVDRVSRLLRLDTDGYPQEELVNESPLELAILRSAVLADRLHVFGFAKDDSKPAEHLEFLQLRVKPLAVAERGEKISSLSREMGFISVLGASLAPAGERAYTLRFEKPPRIEGLWPTQRLASFPGGFNDLPELPPSTPNPADAQRIYAVIAESKMPAALYGWGRHLYLLTREPEAKGGTRWLLHQIDPVADRLERTLVLPTHAAHLLIAPGAKQWAILENSPVGSDAYKTLESLLLLPPVWFSEPISPLEVGKPEVKCAAVVN